MTKAEAAVGEPLDRADADVVHSRTGFAIGGISPIGHLSPEKTWIDASLLGLETVWAAAGAPDAVFVIDRKVLQKVTSAGVAELA